MSILTPFRRPGTGRRQAEPSARVLAANARLGTENQQIRHELASAQQLAAGLALKLEEEQQWNDREHERLTDALHAEQAAHQETKQQLAQAVRSNGANSDAVTVQTDASVLRAAPADEFVDAPAPGPQYARYERVASRVASVPSPLWEAPFATVDPGRIDLAGAL